MTLTNDLAVLIVEDDEPKLRAVRQLFMEEFPRFSIVEAKSLTSAIDAVVRFEFDLAIVDMSLPTYDLARDSSGGGAPQGFGGEDVLRFLSSESTGVNTVVLTQYEEFPSEHQGDLRSLGDVRASLERIMGPKFWGVFHYSGQHGEWRGMLRNVISSICQEG